MKASEQIRKAIDQWEGDVLTCYLDPVGVPTIGKGFTNGSKILTAALGKLKPGVTKITAEQSDKIFAKMLSEEYEPAINMSGAMQNEYDVGVSTVWNLGPKSQNWQWAKLWRAGKVKEAANYLRTHYNTASGRKLPGLVRRRKEEGDILEFGKYPMIYQNSASSNAPEGVARKETTQPPRHADNVTLEAQKSLKKLGIDPGATDGWFGPKTKKAIFEYQKAHPHLANDGVLGPATIAQLRRDTDRIKKIAAKSLGGAGFLGGGAFFEGVSTTHIAIGATVFVILAALYLGWRHRDVFQRRFNRAINKTIEV